MATNNKQAISAFLSIPASFSVKTLLVSSYPRNLIQPSFRGCG